MKIDSPFLLYGTMAIAGMLVGSQIYLFTEIQRIKAGDVSFASTTQTMAETLAMLEKQAEESSAIFSALTDDLTTIQSRVGGFESSLDTLEKLSKTDPELLQKYSKVFFLNEHYAPERLGEIEKEYVYNEERSEKVHALARPHLEDLLNDAKRDGIELYVKSAYRSFNEQSALKSAYTVSYGAGSANRFSADQGYSEHQLGTTVDFISTGQGGNLPGFDKTAAYTWLLENAHKYGFVLSYPKGNTYYIYEPWHWRFVGVELAQDLHNDGKNFYDLEQREIDAYLVTLFE